MERYIKPIILIVGIIVVATVLSKVLNRSETLEEYAARKETEAPSANTSQEDSTSTSTEDSSAETLVAESEQETEDVTRSFYYEPLSTEVIDRIAGISYVENEHITLDELRYVHILHYNFDGDVVEGELICNEAIAQDLLEIFYELYLAQYRLERVRLVDDYGGVDELSMQANNTSCFNYRVVEGTQTLSNHAYGLAIDINPFYNPYVVYKSDGTTAISPAGSEAYADRTANFPYKIDENDLCYKLFIEHGFTWGGNWNSSKDYQHFQKTVE